MPVLMGSLLWRLLLTMGALHSHPEKTLNLPSSLVLKLVGICLSLQRCWSL